MPVPTQSTSHHQTTGSSGLPDGAVYGVLPSHRRPDNDNDTHNTQSCGHSRMSCHYVSPSVPHTHTRHTLVILLHVTRKDPLQRGEERTLLLLRCLLIFSHTIFPELPHHPGHGGNHIPRARQCLYLVLCCVHHLHTHLGSH